ncbi:MAG: hypothetical protein KatS3mg110_1654 [Pirellulaceae bacterium]|nr:MAG: hypothetical protein KatS3mg110_1654 [Pirellulaceae bacterium]
MAGFNQKDQRLSDNSKDHVTGCGSAAGLGVWPALGVGSLVLFGLAATWLNMLCFDIAMFDPRRHEPCALAGCYTQLAVCNEQMYNSFFAEQLQYKSCLANPYTVCTTVEGEPNYCLDKVYYTMPFCQGTWDCRRQQNMGSCR